MVEYLTLRLKSVLLRFWTFDSLFSAIVISEHLGSIFINIKKRLNPSILILGHSLPYKMQSHMLQVMWRHMPNLMWSKQGEPVREKPALH